MAGRLDGRVAAVVGGGSGMGRATARRLAAEGAHVWVGDLSEAAAKTVAGEIGADGGAATAHQLDATDNDALRGFFAAIEREHGKLHVLHDQVGMPGAGGLDVSEADFDRSIDVNVKSAFYVATLGYELVKRAGRKGSHAAHLLRPRSRF
jgi:NAD(P)-dependent dehydrogenase (short-subunit alcohol dehydrogenase family)